MADVNNCPEPTFPTKRISDLSTHDSTNEPKKQKLETPEINFSDNVKETTEIDEPIPEIHKDKGKQKLVNEEDEARKEVDAEIRRLNEKAEIDRKGKGILIEEDDEDEYYDYSSDDSSDDDSDDDDDDDGGDAPMIDELSEESAFVDDPLGEVNLDNILPSRTRRKTINPGAYIANDLPEEDSDESDDPDA